MLKNFNVSTRTSVRPVDRRGLAPLEMVLVLPFLMMLMSAIIIFGYAATWKLRTETVAREVVWRERFDRFANTGSVPPEWPLPENGANISFFDGPPIESYVGQEPLDNEIIAGPLPSIEVNQELLDFTRDVDVGAADIVRQPPIFADLVTFDFTVEHPMLMDRFQFGQMGIRNFSRRIPVIWRTGMDDILESAAIQAAVQAIVDSASWAGIEALDRDREFIAAGRGAPDFYPRVPRFTSIDPEWVSDNRLGPLTNQIRNIPFTLGEATIALYRSQLEEFPELQGVIEEIESWLNGLGG